MSTPAAMDVAGGAIPLSPAAAGGRRRKLKLVTRKAARKALKKMGLKMRGGAGAPEGTPSVVADAKTGTPAVVPAGEGAAGGRRHRTKKHGRKSRRSFF